MNTPPPRKDLTPAQVYARRAIRSIIINRVKCDPDVSLMPPPYMLPNGGSGTPPVQGGRV